MEEEWRWEGCGEVVVQTTCEVGSSLSLSSSAWPVVAAARALALTSSSLALSVVRDPRISLNWWCTSYALAEVSRWYRASDTTGDLMKSPNLGGVSERTREREPLTHRVPFKTILGKNPWILA